MKSHVEKILDVNCEPVFASEPLRLTKSSSGDSDFFVASVTTSMAPYTKYFYLLHEGKNYPIRKKSSCENGGGFLGKIRKTLFIWINEKSKMFSPGGGDSFGLLNGEQFHLYHLGELLAKAIRKVYPQPPGMKDSEYVDYLDDNRIDQKGVVEIRKIFMESLSQGFLDEEVEEMTPLQLFNFRNLFSSKADISTSSIEDEKTPNGQTKKTFKFVRRIIPKYSFNLPWSSVIFNKDKNRKFAVVVLSLISLATGCVGFLHLNKK